MKISDLSQISVKNKQFYYGDKKIEKWWGRTLYHYDSTTKILHTRTFNLYGLFFHCFGYKSKYQDDLRGWLKKNIVIANPSVPESASLREKKAISQCRPADEPHSRSQDDPPKMALLDEKPPSSSQDDPPKKADKIPDTDVSTGESFYLNPRLLFQDTKCGSKDLNFALKQQLLPVMRVRGKFKHYPGTNLRSTVY